MCRRVMRRYVAGVCDSAPQEAAMMQCRGFDRLNRRAVIEALEMTRKREMLRLT